MKIIDLLLGLILLDLICDILCLLCLSSFSEILCLFSPILVLVEAKLLLNGYDLGGWILIIYSFVVFGIYIRRYLLER
jgi:hypothetical protein